jgi:hypothetical protein
MPPLSFDSSRRKKTTTTKPCWTCSLESLESSIDHSRLARASPDHVALFRPTAETDRDALAARTLGVSVPRRRTVKFHFLWQQRTPTFSFFYLQHSLSAAAVDSGNREALCSLSGRREMEMGGETPSENVATKNCQSKESNGEQAGHEF